MSNLETIGKPTPGPWQVHSDQQNIVEAPQAGFFVADTFAHHDSHANALLIAAAPELLAALNGLIRAGHGLNPSSLKWNAAHEAIAKATGAA